MQKSTKIVVILIIAILILLSVAFIWKSATTPENVEPENIEIIDTLEVSYWNPAYPYWTGNSSFGPLLEWPLTTVSDYANISVIIVSATVTEAIRWDNTTEEGKEKLETINPNHTSYASFRRECYLDVNEVLKGNFEIDKIYLKTDTGTFTDEEEYVLFIGVSEAGDSYWAWGPYGYLKKEGTSYKGYGISVSEDELKSSLKISGTGNFIKDIISPKK